MRDVSVVQLLLCAMPGSSIAAALAAATFSCPQEFDAAHRVDVPGARLRGVALIVTNPLGEILMLREYMDKPQLDKRAGMFSIPAETCEPEESELHALYRLCEEELPSFPRPELPGTYIGHYQIVPHAWAGLYAVTTDSFLLPVMPVCAGISPEVGEHQWMPVEAACGLWLRRGPLEMLQDYATGRRGVVRQYCQPPRQGPRFLQAAE